MPTVAARYAPEARWSVRPRRWLATRRQTTAPCSRTGKASRPRPATARAKTVATGASPNNQATISSAPAACSSRKAVASMPAAIDPTGARGLIVRGPMGDRRRVHVASAPTGRPPRRLSSGAATGDAAPAAGTRACRRCPGSLSRLASLVLVRARWILRDDALAGLAAVSAMSPRARVARRDDRVEIRPRQEMV